MSKWSKAECGGLKWNRQHLLKGSNTLQIKLNESLTAFAGSFAKLEKRYKTTPFKSKFCNTILRFLRGARNV